MTLTAFEGPVVSFGNNPVYSQESNPDLGPSLFWGGTALADPRTAFAYIPGQRQGAQTFGWLGVDNVNTLSIVPYTATAGAIVASANPTTATLALVSANSSTTGVYVTTLFTRSDTGAADASSLVALDAYASCGTCTCAAGVLTVGTNTTMPIAPGMTLLTASGTVSSGVVLGTQIVSQLTAGTAGLGVAGTYLTNNTSLTFTSSTVTLAYQNVQQCVVPVGGTGSSIFLWNPMALIGRLVAVTAAASATYATATITGYDIYGFPMTEAITITAGSQVAGKKAWKYIKSVVLSGGTADTTHAYSVDTVSTFGLPLRSDSYGDIIVNYAAALNLVTLISAATSYLPADRTVATATTGDVRGTIGAFTASTGANKLITRQTVGPYNVGFNAGLFGVAQFSTF